MFATELKAKLMKSAQSSIKLNLFNRLKKHEVTSISEKTGFSRGYVVEVLKGDRNNKEITIEALTILDNNI